MTTDNYREWDAAYVLGSLSPAERREYERHLAECPACAAAVADLAGLPGILGTVPADRALMMLDRPEPAEEVPPSLLPNLLAASRRARRRSRFRVAGLVAAAAAAAAVIALLLPAGIARLNGPDDEGRTVAMTQTFRTSITADARLVPTEWGTRIDITCRYAQATPSPGAPPPRARPYVLVVTDRQGTTTELATWNAGPGSVTEPSATTSLPMDQIRSIDIRSVTSKRTLLTATVS